MSEESLGRHRIIRNELIGNDVQEKLSVDIGCKFVHQGNIAIDINSATNPEILADARYLPIKSNTFDRAFFTDVIEHLPSGQEKKALAEIRRVLKTKGELILTTPNDYWLYTYLDPAKYTQNHRHYQMKLLRKMVEESGFKIDQCFAKGGFWQMAWILCYSCFTYIFGLSVPHFLEIKVDKEYDKILGKKGYTIFMKATPTACAPV
jgi:predicted SAM-dependent methyltransferase